MAYKDLRRFIADLEVAGELHRVKAPVDWDIEIGAITRELFHRKRGPAVIFENVRGSQFPLFTGAMFGAAKYARMIDVETPTVQAITQRLAEAIDKTVPPVVVVKVIVYVATIH